MWSGLGDEFLSSSDPEISKSSPKKEQIFRISRVLLEQPVDEHGASGEVISSYRVTPGQIVNSVGYFDENNDISQVFVQPGQDRLKVFEGVAVFFVGGKGVNDLDSLRGKAQFMENGVIAASFQKIVEDCRRNSRPLVGV